MRRIIYNEDGDTLGGYRGTFHEAPIAVDDYLRLLFEPLVGTHVDTYVWCFGAIQSLAHDPELGLKRLENVHPGSGKFESLHNWREWRNLNAFFDSGNNPPVFIADAAHDLGMEMFISLRMNDAHDAAASDIYDTRLKQEHPDWLIGEPGATYEAKSIPWWMRKGFDYAVEDVRNYVISIVDAMLSFPADGVELDFMSHPFVFKLGQERERAPLLTDMVRKVKESAAERGKLVMVRVPATIERCEKIGYDVNCWIREGLVDLLSLGRSVTPASIPSEEWAQAVAGTACQFFPSVNPNHHNKLCLAESLRAFAMQHLRDGAHGVYLFNFFMQPFSRGWKTYHRADEYGWDALRELGDVETLAYRDKLYVFDWIRKETPGAYGYCVPEELVDLPLELAEEGQSGTVRFRIGDRLDGSAPQQITLRIEVANLSGLDELKLSLNGSRLFGEERTHPYQYGADLAYPVSPHALKTGANTLEISVEKRNQLMEPPLIVEKGEISIHYR